MPPRRVVRGRPTRRNMDPQEQEVLNAPEVQPPQGEVTNAEFWNAIRMLTQVMVNQAGQQRVDRQDVADTSKVCELLRMNP
uniref:Putative ovule protein n=1 Tax=Solanum chacoense TaxID=4108 RepID=A0A0V0GR31_SOLCH